MIKICKQILQLDLRRHEKGLIITVCRIAQKAQRMALEITALMLHTYIHTYLYFSVQNNITFFFCFLNSLNNLFHFIPKIFSFSMPGVGFTAN